MTKTELKKTENFNLRIDEKLEFAVSFAMRAGGQIRQSFGEAALRAAADATKDQSGRNWRKFWDPARAVREISLIRWSVWDTDVDEDRLAEFVRAHAVFFFEDGNEIINREASIVLWDDVEKLSQKWFDSRRSDYWKVGHSMAEQLKSAGLAPPMWPPVNTEPPVF